MSNWRRPKPRTNNNNINHHHLQRATQSSKPPLANPKLSVPAWERDFCAVIGCVPWWKVLEGKQFMYLYDKVVQWDDSAGEDAFKKAKSRFWAEINGFPCDLSLPDPDIYIDDVDWDAEVDTELILDLERGGSDPGEEEHVVILDALVLSSQYNGLCSGTGWGEAEPINTGWGEAEPINTGWGEAEPINTGWGEAEPINTGWGEAEPIKTGWGEAEPINTGWGEAEPINTGWGEAELIKEIGGTGKQENSWAYQKHCDGWNEESWERKGKTETWDQMNKKNSFKIKTWDHKNGRDQGRETREWRKRGEAPRGGGDRVGDCRWRKNGRGRSRGGFQQQHSNGWGWTESF